MDKKKAKKIAEATADTAAEVTGGIFRTITKVIATLVLIGIVSGLLFTCIFAYYVKTSLSRDLDVSLEDITLNQASTIYYTDSNGNIKELAALHSEENRVWVDYDNIPKNMMNAAIAIEDQRFETHKGVDWYRTVGAFVNMFVAMKNDFGGSTITQQLLKNTTGEDDITVQRKLLEIFRALELEQMYEKDEIMEWYLNAIFFGQGCYGVGTAANMYFDKEVWELSLAECASIIGITNNPSLYDPYISRANNKKRQELILSEMYEQGKISYDEWQAAVAEELVFRRAENTALDVEINSYYVDAVVQDVRRDLMEEKGINEKTANDIIYNGGLQIYAYIDMDIQNVVDNIYADPANFPSAISKYGESISSGAVVMDPYTGKILAMAGGIGEKTGNLVWNNATDSHRPPGSSFKPLATYGPAVDQGLITPSTLVNDADDIELKGTWWYPVNSNYSYRGIVTILDALTSSLNTVSAQILDKLGLSVSYRYLTENLGFENSLTDVDASSYAALSLGQITNGVTVREMAQAYSAFPNDGIFTYARTYSHINDSEGNLYLDNPADSKVAFKANTAWTMTYMMNYAATYGTGYETYLGIMPHAGKTGSSSNYEDRWFCGFTPYYTCAVWTGYAEKPAYISSYGNPSSQVWQKIMYQINEGLPYKAFKWPTLYGPTNIFGDLEESESPSPSESPEVSESPSPSPSETPEESATPSPEETETPEETIPPEPSEEITPSPVPPSSGSDIQ